MRDCNPIIAISQVNSIVFSIEQNYNSGIRLTRDKN